MSDITYDRLGKSKNKYVTYITFSVLELQFFSYDLNKIHMFSIKKKTQEISKNNHLQE